MWGERAFWLVRVVVSAPLLAVGGWAAWRLYRDPRCGWAWKLPFCVLGLVLGFVVSNLTVRYSAGVAVAGFPFPAALSIRQGEQWIDYFSNDLVLAFLGNLGAGLAVTHLGTLALRRWFARTSRLHSTG